MITHAAVRKLFFDRVNSKFTPELLLPKFPSLLLERTIDECLEGYKVNDKSLYEHLGIEKFLDFLYFKWKDRYALFLIPDTANMSFEIEGINPKHIQDRQQQFEEIFAKIDALEIFQKAPLI